MIVIVFHIDFLSGDILPPNIVVTDQSLTLMMAATKSFTQYSNLNKYISVYSLLIKHEDIIDIPYYMIKNDLHIMHLLSS